MRLKRAPPEGALENVEGFVEAQIAHAVREHRVELGFRDQNVLKSRPPSRFETQACFPLPDTAF